VNVGGFHDFLRRACDLRTDAVARDEDYLHDLMVFTSLHRDW
jgi:hypothetical protein